MTTVKASQLIAQSQEPLGHQQMAGGGNRQEFGQAFDDAQNDGDYNVVHGGPAELPVET